MASNIFEEIMGLREGRGPLPGQNEIVEILMVDLEEERWRDRASRFIPWRSAGDDAMNA